MKALTVDQIMAFNPCSCYPRERVAALWGVREALAAAEIAALEIPEADRVWALCKWLDALSQSSARLFACDYADRALSRVANPDPRSVAAVAVARRHAGGHATDEELVAAEWAARVAAWEAEHAMDAVASEAAWEAAASARVAAWVAALGGSSAGEHAADRVWQLAELVRRIEEVVS
jgi:hypothetical protein